jgi:hydroxyacylglutathione hydrolase
MTVTPVPILADNYAYVLEFGDRVVVVDPGDATPVVRLLARSGAHLATILLTHHHSDHIGGVRDLLDAFPGTPVVAGARDHGRIREQTVLASEGDRIPLPSGEARVLEVPGHTRGHVAYFVADAAGGDVFTGDTLFGLTMGNLFEGSPVQMLDSLRKIRDLPACTRIWCGHEYTRQYAADALKLDPGSTRLAERVQALSRTSGPTIPLDLAEEMATNPYLRWDDPGVRRHLCTRTDETTFERLCAVG